MSTRIRVTALSLMFTAAVSLQCARASEAPAPSVAQTAAPAAAAATQGEPDYAPWNQLLGKYYDERTGMNYRALKAGDLPRLQAFRQQLGRVNPASLSRKAQLAYWINVYNTNVVAHVAENYPTDSIRDLSTDPIRRLNVFDKKIVPTPSGKISLNDVENKRVRETFKDARIHFAINCAARSCPPIRPEAFTGAKLDAQLDDQTRKFLNGPNGVKVTTKGSRTTVRTTKIMDWFGEDFDKWGGGREAFIRRYVKVPAGTVKIEYDDYSWALNDRK